MSSAANQNLDYSQNPASNIAVESVKAAEINSMQ
jgi:hypothetical protein